METRIAYYRLDDSEPFWGQIVEEFNKHLSKNGVPYFQEHETNEEAEFVRFCGDKNIKLTRKVLIAHSGKGPLESPFFYLAVRDTREYAQEFVRLACDGGGKGMCWNGAEQFQKVTITPQIASLVARNDIVVKIFPISPRVYLISRRLKELMEPMRFSGIAFVPCLEAGQKYSSEEIAFDSHLARLEEEATCFQMSITSRAPGKPSLGNLLVVSRCPRCQAVNIIEGDKEWEFRAADLAQGDFQWVGDVTSDNEGDQHLGGQVAIVSARALSFLIENRIKGLRQYLVDPPVKHAVVQIRN